MNPHGLLYGAGLVHVVGDVDGDERPDFVVANHTEGINWGCVRLHSGKGGSELYATKPNGAWHFGLFMDAIGDVDGDGVSDFVVGGEHIVSGGAGLAWIHSGATGVELAELVRRGDEVVQTTDD